MVRGLLSMSVPSRSKTTTGVRVRPVGPAPTQHRPQRGVLLVVRRLGPYDAQGHIDPRSSLPGLVPRSTRPGAPQVTERLYSSVLAAGLGRRAASGGVCYVGAERACRSGTTTTSSESAGTRAPRKSRARSRSWPLSDHPDRNQDDPGANERFKEINARLPGAVRPEPPRDVRPLRPPRGGARLALRHGRSVRRAASSTSATSRSTASSATCSASSASGAATRATSSATSRSPSRRPPSAARSRCATSASSRAATAGPRAPRRAARPSRAVRATVAVACASSRASSRSPSSARARAAAAPAAPCATPCSGCRGSGLVTSTESLKVSLPAGVERGRDEARLRRRQQAAPRQGAGRSRDHDPRPRAPVLPARGRRRAVHGAHHVHARGARRRDRGAHPRRQGEAARCRRARSPAPCCASRARASRTAAASGAATSASRWPSRCRRSSRARQRELLEELAKELGEDVQPQRKSFMGKLRDLFG